MSSKPSSSSGSVTDLTSALEKTDLSSGTPQDSSTHSGRSSVSERATTASTTSSPGSVGAAARIERTGPSGSSAPVERIQVNIPKKDLEYQTQTFCSRPSMKAENNKQNWPVSRVDTNYYRMQLNQVISIFHYDVEIVLDKKGAPFKLTKREECRKWFFEFFVQHKNTVFLNLRPEEIIYNDVNMLWTKSRLSFPGNRGEATLPITIGKGPRSQRAQVTFKYTGHLTFDPNNLAPNDRPIFTSFVDCVMSQRLRNPLHSDHAYFTTHGRSIFFSPIDRNGINEHFSVPLGNGLEAWTGLHGAIKTDCEAGILYNCDISHSVFQKQHLNLVQFYVEIVCKQEWNSSREVEYQRQLKEAAMNMGQRRRLEDALKGQSVQIIMNNNKEPLVKKFVALAPKSAAAQTFRMENGQIVTIEEYFQGKYNITLMYPYLPCVKVGTKGSMYPMELCYTTSNPRKLKGVLPEHVKAAMIRKCAFTPSHRKRIIQELTTGIDPLGDGRQTTRAHVEDCDAVMKEYGVELVKEFISVPSTTLPAPKLIYGGGDSFYDEHNEGLWEVVGQSVNTNNKFRAPLESQKNVVIPGLIYVMRENEQKIDVNPAFTICDVLANFGVKFAERSMCVAAFYDSYRDGPALVGKVQEYKNMVLEKHGPSAIPLLFFVFPMKNAGKSRERLFSDYAYIKLVCDTMVGVYSQGILYKNYLRCTGNFRTCATAHNIAIKVLAKLGVQQYKLERDGKHRSWTKFTNPDEPTLVLGVDVTHPDKEDRMNEDETGMSIGCVVGNIDFDCMNFRPSVRIHRGGKEDMFSIVEEVRQRLLDFMEHTGKAPKHIVVYRDGVGESQFQRTLFEEKSSIFQAWDICCSTEDRPTLTYIVLTKRHHTRFFATKASDTKDTAGNLKPGTLVESGVTSKSLFDFFLIGHRGMLGTSRPAHYHVLYDDWAPAALFWQTITFCLSYSYVRCPRTVSQPAPVLYAHLAAKKAKDYLLAYAGTNDRPADRGNYAHAHQQQEAIQIHKALNGMVFL